MRRSPLLALRAATLLNPARVYRMLIACTTALVTGGASGLGEACVRRLVAGRGRAIIADLNEGRGQDLARELGTAAHFIRTDVTDEASVQAALDLAIREF